MYKNEAQLRALVAHSLKRRLDDGKDRLPVRQNRRVPLIEAALAPARDRLDEASYARLCSALALVFGTESMLVFRDVAPLSENDARRVKELGDRRAGAAGARGLEQARSSLREEDARAGGPEADLARHADGREVARRALQRLTASAAALSPEPRRRSASSYHGSAMTLPLDGVEAIDLGTPTPGKYAAFLLAEMGAAVVRVERPDAAGARDRPLSDEDALLNRGKRSLVLDLRHQDGRSVLHRLAARADVLIECYRPGVAERLGAGWSELSGRNPRLVCCSLSGFGRTGPARDVAAYDLVFAGWSGLLAAWYGTRRRASRAPTPPTGSRG